MIDLAWLNRADEDAFTEALAGVFEHSSWIARRAAAARPFASRFEMLDAMWAVLQAATRTEQLGLIRAHPELAGKAAVRNELTPESTQEQAGAGLDACTPEEFAQLTQLNAAYNARFGFPFILAVKGHDRRSVIAAFESRLQHAPEQEIEAALVQIRRIAEFRLSDLVLEPAGAAIMAMSERLAAHSDTEDALTCAFLTPAHRACAQQLRDWMLAAGMRVEIDAIGNVVGRWRCGTAGARTLLTGSHYDTVADGGRYDGRLGILLPIAVVRELRLRGKTLPFDLEIVGFSDEEGLRYRSTFLGSSALAGDFDLSLLERPDAEGITLREALLSAGLDPQRIPDIARDPATLLGYVEVHIEQGPVLLQEDRAVGVVSAIAGSLRYLVTLTGVAGHAGTVPMALRQDAAAAAAEVVLAVERRCAQASGLVGTVGLLQVPNGAVNTIPGRCELSLDIRAPDDATRDAAAADILATIDEIVTRRRVAVQCREVMRAAAVACNARLQQTLAQSIERVTGRDARTLPSGAGHDAMKLARITDIAMLFVRCGAGGISHHPDETLDAADADIAARVFADFLEHAFA